MKFRFCGDLDCPDWILAEMNTLSKLSSIKMKILCQMIAKTLVGEPLDEQKAIKLLSDAKLGADDMRACTPAVSHILSQSARYEVDEDALNSELQQLGLPKEHATALCKVYSENVGEISEKLAAKSLRTSTMEEVSSAVTETGVRLKLRLQDNIQGKSTTHDVAMTGEQLALLLKDLRSAREEMENLPK